MVRMFPRVTLHCAVVSLTLVAVGCGIGTSKVSSTLSNAEAKLDQSETALKALKGKPPEEAIEELQKVYDTVEQALTEVTDLRDEKFTNEEKERFDRVLAKLKERKGQLREAKDEILKEVRKGKE